MDERSFAVTLDRRDAYAFSVKFDQADLPQPTMDEPPPLGAGEGPNAARLLGAAIGHCLSASLLFCLEKAHIEVGELEASVEGTIERNERGRFRIGEIRVKLTPRIAADAAPRLGRCLEIFEDFCIVTESVRRGISVAVEVAPELGADSSLMSA